MKDEKTEDKFIEKNYNKSLKKLNSFFSLNIKKKEIKIHLIKNRKEIDLIRKKETEPWVVGWTSKKTIFLLNKKSFEKESSHKYSDKKYSALIIHEMTHIYYGLISKAKNPAWLIEGLPTFLSGQNKFKKPVKKFRKVLDLYDTWGKGVYNESGFFVELLIKKFGKRKLIDLIKSTKNCKNKREFYNLFKKIYGFDLNYKEINKLHRNR